MFNLLNNIGDKMSAFLDKISDELSKVFFDNTPEQLEAIKKMVADLSDQVEDKDAEHDQFLAELKAAIEQNSGTDGDIKAAIEAIIARLPKKVAAADSIGGDSPAGDSVAGGGEDTISAGGEEASAA